MHNLVLVKELMKGAWVLDEIEINTVYPNSLVGFLALIEGNEIYPTKAERS